MFFLHKCLLEIGNRDQIVCFKYKLHYFMFIPFEDHSKGQSFTGSQVLITRAQLSQSAVPKCSFQNFGCIALGYIYTKA